MIIIIMRVCIDSINVNKQEEKRIKIVRILLFYSDCKCNYATTFTIDLIKWLCCTSATIRMNSICYCKNKCTFMQRRIMAMRLFKHNSIWLEFLSLTNMARKKRDRKFVRIMRMCVS